MKDMFVHYFIPHSGNDHKPHALRKKALIGLVVVVICIEALFISYIFLSVQTKDFLAAVLPGVLVSLTNETRISTNVEPLSTNSLLEQAAQLKANDMASKGYFAHTSPEGHEPWYWLKQVGYTYTYAGENLAVNFIDSEDVTDAWMKSPSHRANIINNNYKEIGIATASGVYKGKKTVFVVQFFGTPQYSYLPPQTPSPTNQYAVAPSATPQPLSQPSSVPSSAQQAPVSPKGVLGSDTNVVSGQNVPSTAEVIPTSPQTQTNDDLKTERQPVAEQYQSGAPNQALPTALEKISTSPRTVTNMIFATLMFLTVIALALAVFIAIRIQHPAMIAGAVSVIVFMAGMIYFNEFILNRGVELPNTIAATVVGSF